MTLDLSSFDTRKVADMYFMFESCRELKTIYVGDGCNLLLVTCNLYSLSVILVDLSVKCVHRIRIKSRTFAAEKTVKYR